nr:hypothetical protein [Thermogemmata fonticola]
MTMDFYYSDQWQVLEERVGGSTTVQYVWSPVYVDALILRDRDSDGDGTLDERLWVAQDANFNVTALVDDSGNVVERYIYDPFGQPTVLMLAGTSWRPASSPGSICTRAAASTPPAACTTSVSATILPPSAAGRALIRSPTPPGMSTSTAPSAMTRSTPSIRVACCQVGWPQLSGL